MWKRARLGRFLPLVLFAMLSAESFGHLALHHRAPGLLLAWPAFVLLAVRWPGAAIIGASVLVRLGFAGVCCTDQIVVSQAAWDRVSGGEGGPYGIGYAETTPPGAPFPYGPVGLIWWFPGPIVEFAAATGIMAMLAWQRALITLVVFAMWDPWIWQTMIGVNDYSPGLLILGGLVLLRSYPLAGAGLLALAAALKPYAFAWFVPAVGYGGAAVGAVLTAATLLLWSPVFVWWGGVVSFLETIRLAAAAHPEPNALNVPILRWLAVPFVALSVMAKRWDDMVILGSAAFVIFLFLDRWASHAYWFAVIPPLGLAVESRLGFIESVRPMLARRRGDARRDAWASFLYPRPNEPKET